LKHTLLYPSHAPHPTRLSLQTLKQQRQITHEELRASQANDTWHIRTTPLQTRTHPQPSQLPSEVRQSGEHGWNQRRPNPALYAVRNPPLAAAEKACTCKHDGYAARLARPDHLSAAIDNGTMNEATENLINDTWERIR
jgi:hypothetical protein